MRQKEIKTDIPLQLHNLLKRKISQKVNKTPYNFITLDIYKSEKYFIREYCF